MKNEIQKKEASLAMYTKLKKDFLKNGDKETADKAEKMILKIQKQIKELKEAKLAPAPAPAPAVTPAAAASMA